MRWLLIYKGEYGTEVAGPEIRYLRLGAALIKRGDQVIVAGTARKSQRVTSNGPSYVSLHKLVHLSKQLFAADVVVLHGGGPLLMLLALLAGLFAGTRLVLDSYSLHWIELHQAHQSGRRSGALLTHFKVQFNLLRFLYGLVMFDNVVVANQRQLDLARGALAAMGFLSQLGERIAVIPFGCDPVVEQKSKTALIAFASGQISVDDTVVGWLGGAWDWFDMDQVVKSFAASSSVIPASKFVFFGLSKERFERLQAIYKTADGTEGALLNLPWIAMEKRLDVWSGIDLAVVWGARDIENDYASRTRNFDCISAGVPIVQNWDEQWGPIIRDHQCGAIASAGKLSAAIESECGDRETLAQQSESIMALYPNFSWTGCAEKFSHLEAVAKRRFHDRILYLLAGLVLVPPFLLLGVYDFSVLRRRRPSE
jgi:hypothetical protein